MPNIRRKNIKRSHEYSINIEVMFFNIFYIIYHINQRNLIFNHIQNDKMLF
jgi:hypothetical protein